MYNRAILGLYSQYLFFIWSSPSLGSHHKSYQPITVIFEDCLLRMAWEWQLLRHCVHSDVSSLLIWIASILVCSFPLNKHRVCLEIETLNPSKQTVKSDQLQRIFQGMDFTTTSDVTQTCYMWDEIPAFDSRQQQGFLFSNQPDAIFTQIYSVIKLYMFRATSLPIIRSSLLYIRHW